MVTIHTYCAAHTEVLLPLPENATIMELGASGTVANNNARILNAYNTIPNGKQDHPYLGGTLATIAIYKDLVDIDPDPNDIVHYCHYRKYICKDVMGVPAPNYRGMRLVTETEIEQKSDIIFNPKLLTDKFLICQPFKIRHLAKQYRSSHYLPDLLRFIAIGCELGILSQDDAEFILQDDHLFPGGIELGFYPADVFLKVAGEIAEISQAFMDELPMEKRTQAPEKFRPKTNHWQNMTRPIAFCSERVSSFLLEKEIKLRFRGRVPRRLFGTMYTVTDQGKYITTRD
jgi:hypothetical protein